LPHKTIWILHENVQANNRALGLGPTNVHAPQWTVPVIRDTHSGAEPVAIVDSDKIADYLEAVYPTRPIATAALRSAQQAHIDAINRCFAANVRRIVVPSLVDNLEGSNRAYFKNSRAEIFGTRPGG
jgi:glutathione S-transferase